MMDAELKNLRIDRTPRRSGGPARWATRWIVAGVTVFRAKRFSPRSEKYDGR
jgi:hypothetical protein